MSPKTSPKEEAVWERFRQAMVKIQQNPNQSIGTFIEKLAEEKPEHIALYYQDAFWTWQAFNEETNKIANFFLNLGLKRGESIALMMENSPEYLFLIGGINKIQGVSALINFNQRKLALTHAFNVIEPKWIVVDGDCLQPFNDVFENLSLKKDQIFVINNAVNITHEYRDLLSELKFVSNSNPNTTFNSIIRETALYIFTSGTTGLPKAVIMQNYKLFTQSIILGPGLSELTAHDIIYIPTPLYHNVGIGCSFMIALLIGAKIALKKRFSASEFWKDIQKFQATFFYYVGEIPRYLLNQPPTVYEKNHTLKKMTGLGLRKEIWEQFQSRFKVDHIYEMYGSTEGSRPLFNAEEVPGMIGRNNMPGFALAKVDPETGEFYKNERGYCVKCKPGDIGMGLIKIQKGEKSFFTGYKDQEKTQKKMMRNIFRKNDTYFNTNDMLKLHDNLWVSFIDRFGDTFRWKGENVSTLEVEAVLNSHPAIQLSTVYGVATPNTEGKAGMAAIKINQSLKFDIDNFSHFVLDVLPKYAIPIFIRLRDDLEVVGPFKLKKTDLRQEAYNIKNIQDKLLFWDSNMKKYVDFTNTLYQDLLEGNLRI